jgi:Protein of unknown function (DUF3102)
MTADQKLPTPEAPALSAPEAAAQVELSEHANAIRSLGPRVVADVIEIGRRLALCKNHLRHGLWTKWLEREFGWSQRTADNFISISKLEKSEKISNLNLPLSGLYLLARPSVSKGVRAEIIQRAKAGEKINCGMIAHTIHAQVSARKRRVTTAPPQPTRTKPPRPATHIEILDVWLRASPTERKRAVNSLGLETWLNAVPEDWWPELERRILALAARAATSTDRSIIKPSAFAPREAEITR